MYWHHDKREPQPVLDAEVRLTVVPGKHPPWRTDRDPAEKNIVDIVRATLKQDLDTYVTVHVQMREERETSMEVQLRIVATVTEKVLQFFAADRIRLVENNIQSELSTHFGRSTTSVSVMITPEPNFALKLPSYLGQSNAVLARPDQPATIHPPPQQHSGMGGAVAVAPVVVTVPTGPSQPQQMMRHHGPEQQQERGSNGFFPAIAIAVLALVAAAVLFPRLGNLEAAMDTFERRLRDIEQQQEWDRWRFNSERFGVEEPPPPQARNRSSNGSRPADQPPNDADFKPPKPAAKPPKEPVAEDWRARSDPD
jgi:hypothetical protein